MDTTSAAPKLRWTLTRKIYAILAGVGIGLIVIAALSFRSVGSLRTNNAEVVHTYQVLEHLAHISAGLKDAETGQRGFLITGEQDDLAPYEQARKDLEADQQDVRALTADNPAQQQRLDRLAPLVRAKLAELQETIDLRAGPGGLDAALKVVLTDESKAVMEQIRAVLGEMEAQERGLLGQRSAAAASSAGVTRSVTLAGSGILLLLMAIAGYLLSRNIARPVLEVTTALKALEHGDLTVTVPVRTTDELAVMATSLNAAASGLRATIGGQMQDAAVTLAAAAEQLSTVSTQLQ